MRGRIRCLALLGLTWGAPLPAGSLAPLPGSLLWLQAEALSWELPGSRPPSSEERQLLAEALAAPGLEAAAAALRSARSPAPDLGIAIHGDEAALTHREAVALVAGRRAPTLSGRDLPGPVFELAAETFARAEVARAQLALVGTATPEAIQRWMGDVAARARGASPGEGLPEAVRDLAPVPLLSRALGGDEEARRACWSAFREVAWARPAVRAGLRARVGEAHALLAGALAARRVPVKVKVEPGPGSPVEGQVVSLAGGRLGTATTEGAGTARLEPVLGDLARVARGGGVVTLQIVQQRQEVMRRELTVERFLGAAEALDLGSLTLAPARGRLLVEVPGWERLLAGQVGDALPVKGTVQVGGAMRPETLGRDGRAVVPSLVPGLHLVSLSGQDESGSVVHRAFGVVEVPPGGEVVCTLQLPIEEVAEPVKRARVSQVREDLAALAARYKAGRIPRGAFRRAAGAIYQIHREVTGDKRKDETFSREVRVAMQAAFQSVLPEAVSGGDPGPALGELERGLEELEELLPDFLRGDRPAGRLDEYLQVEVGAALAVEEGTYRSIRHRRADLRRAREATQEVAGIRELVTGVVAPRLAQLTATLRKRAEAYRDGYTHFHLAGMDYEKRFLRLAKEHLDPLRELVRRARQLDREHLVEDLRARVAAEAASVDAAESRLAAQGRRWAALRSRCEELGRRLARRVVRPPEVPPGVAPLVERVSAGEPPGVALLRELGIEESVPEALAVAGEVVAERMPVASLWDRARSLHQVLDARIRADLVAAYERRAGEEELDELARVAPTQRRQLLAERTEGVYEELAVAMPEVPPWVASAPLAETHLRALARAWDRERQALAEAARARASEAASAASTDAPSN